MGADKSPPAAEKGTSGHKRPLVEDPTGQRPFMRGIMVHSLMSRGASFEEAYRAAGLVRDRIRGRDTVSRDELARLVEEVFTGSVLERAPVRLPRPVFVTGEGAHSPFSKGVLSQSLLAAAVEPNDAFDVAREIEAQLVGSGVEKIEREDLRRLAHRMVERKLGERPAERYRVWRNFQASERPLILLLGGTSGVGKTALAQEVAHRLGISRTSSTDAIRQVMRIMLSKALVPAIHASSYEAHEVLPELPGEEDPVVAGFRAQAATVSVGVRAMMDRAVEENTSLLLDGVSVAPGLIDLGAYADSAFVIFLLVATLDEDAFRARFAARGRDAVRRAPHRYIEKLDAILRIQDYLLELAEAHDVPIVDNVSFDACVLSILRHVTETLRERGSFDDRTRW
jgi:2-phosphoglycerate kinase